jgi:hypoxanthine phosphoribosyltransferase
MTDIPGASFAHASEAEMARILDFYAVRWLYEPHTFPILWNLDGDVVESFSPDFYLPDLDLYLEMTTLKQRLVRKKNRKLRRLREIYPDLRIKLFYARDFRALMLKYGKVALVDELSGSSGHIVPERPVELGPEDAVAMAAAAGIIEPPIEPPTEPPAPPPYEPPSEPPLELPTDPPYEPPAPPPTEPPIEPPMEPPIELPGTTEGGPRRRSRAARRRRAAARRCTLGSGKADGKKSR